jgi:hypothetical protein
MKELSLETFWRRGNKRFEALCQQYRRLQSCRAANIKIESFDLCLQNSLEIDKCEISLWRQQAIAQRYVRVSENKNIVNGWAYRAREC